MKWACPLCSEDGTRLDCDPVSVAGLSGVWSNAMKQAQAVVPCVRCRFLCCG
ncbi:hypothetical protein [Anaerostipes faecis]|uniref:hypothetical protein n=1 Tax=Anaerostipes faecis TaxID=2880702 RepID=UPI002657EB53|nr:hypothetical protein [Anaerostipes faecis]